MPMLPDPQRMDRIQAECLALFDAGVPLDAVEVTERLMSLPELPMHRPYHHFLVPAALLTAAHLRSGSPRERLEKDLKTARERAGIIPGGFCGQYGCCGAAVGAGIFTSVWQGTDPHSRSGWAACHEMTARCLSAIATVDGPRCCKRDTYFALEAALPAARELLGADLGEGADIVCTRHHLSRDCRGADCPFFPKEERT